MPKLTIDLPADTNEKLKAKAKADYRSLTNYITVTLINLANSTTSTPTSTISTTSTPTLTLDQLQQQGVADIKFAKQKHEPVLSETEQEFQQNKLLLQQNKIKQQRLKFLETKALEILGYTPRYIEENNQKAIDRILSEYQTEEDIIDFLKRMKYEDDLYGESEDTLSTDTDTDTNEPDNEDYRKIKNYFIENSAIQDYEFDDLIAHAKINDIQYIKDYYQYYIFNALRISHDVELDDEQWTELLKNLY